MKLVLVGAVESTQLALESMCEAGHSPALLVTLPPSLANRHSDFVDLGPLAEKNNVNVFHATKTNDPATLSAIKDVNPDVILVIGWSQLCGAEFRALPSVGSIGFHPSALPKLRGRAVLPWTILLAESQSGVSFFWLEEGADTGDIAAQTLFDIDPEHETARSLYDKMLKAMTATLPKLLAELVQGEAKHLPQDHAKATICAKRVADDGLIDWYQSAKTIDRLIRAVGAPYPGAFTHINGEKITVEKARLLTSSPYIGLVGQIQTRTPTGFVVMCGDLECIEITEWSGVDTQPPVHSKLG